MKAYDLYKKLKDYLEQGSVDGDAEVEFLIEGDDWNSGSSILNTLIVRDGDGNDRLFLTNFEKVIG